MNSLILSRRGYGPANVLLLALLAVGVWLGSLPFAARIFAHSDYDTSTPGKSESVPQSPATLDMYTTQDMFKEEGADELQVLDGAGNRVDDGTTVVDDDNRRHMSVGLQPDLPPGRYTVHWKTFSDEDGERYYGAFAFYVGITPTAEQLQEDQDLEAEVKEQAEATAEAAEAGEATPSATASAEPSPTVLAPSNDEDDGGTSGGVIVGVIGAVVVVVAVIGGGFVIYRRRGA
ncbi:MAG: copper resistance protein CopC [Dehalococcoidia bacterium]